MCPMMTAHNSLLDVLNIANDADDRDEGIPDLFMQSPYVTTDEALQVLSDKRNLFGILSLNCQSLFSKFDQLKVYVNYYGDFGYTFSVICLQETWLDSSHDVTSLQLEGYNFIFKPKLASLHGGVAFYIKDTLDFKILPEAINDEICDSLFIEVNLNTANNLRNGKVILGNVYRPPRDHVANYNSFTMDLERTLSSFQNSTKVAILGDFNIDLMKLNEKEYVNFFFDSVMSKGYLPKITLPTRITSQSKTLIDNCFVKTMNSLSDTSSGILLQEISDHLPYFVCFDRLHITQNENKVIKFYTQTPNAIVNLKMSSY